MSTLKVNNIQDATGNDAISIDSSGNVTLAAGFVPQTAMGRRNLIINGAMQVAQRGTSATGINTSGYKTVDRFTVYLVNDAVLSASQSTDAPDGFSNSLKWEVTTADTSIGSTQYAQIGHLIEGQNLQSLAYGTSSAKTVTLSFWVKSNKTGTYCVSFNKSDATRYDYVAEYTIDSANTWEQKVITIAPDSNIQASAGAIANDNGSGIVIKWVLATGSSRYGTVNTWNSSVPADATSNQVNWLDSTSNNFYITGVQLEVGSVATPFEHRSYGEELALCQRYYQTINNFIAFSAPSSNPYALWTATVFPTQMRTSPSVSLPANIGFEEPYGTSDTATGVTIQQPTNASCCLQFAVSSVAYGAVLRSYPNSGAVNFDAEL